MRPLRAVLVKRATPRLIELLAAALDGTGPAILPLDAGLSPGRLAEVVAALGPGSIEDAEGVTTVRSADNEGVAEGTAVVVRTSGSTGASKGVELSAAALRHSARASLDRLGAKPGERWLCCLPATHVAGLQVLVRSLLSGTEPVLAERADAETVAGSGCAHVSLVPTQLHRLLLEVLGCGPAMPLAGYSSVLLGGAPAPASLLDAARAAGVPVVTTYGMTETCGGCVYDGVPLDGVRVAIRSDDDDSPAESGRIWISGPVLFSGYRGAAGRARRRWRDGWFRTGDLGRLDSSGRLVVRGRADDVINTGGHKVVPGEVAAVAADLPGRQGRGGGGATRPRMGRTGHRGGGAGRSGRPAGAGIAPSACAGAAAALRCSKQGRNGRCRSHAPEREARHRTAQARAAAAGTN